MYKVSYMLIGAAIGVLCAMLFLAYQEYAATCASAVDCTTWSLLWSPAFVLAPVVSGILLAVLYEELYMLSAIHSTVALACALACLALGMYGFATQGQALNLGFVHLLESLACMMTAMLIASGVIRIGEWLEFSGRLKRKGYGTAD